MTSEKHLSNGVDESSRLSIILAVAFFGIMGGALIGPVLPALMEPFSVLEEEVGLVLGVYTFSTAATMPFVGPLIDKIGRKTVLVVFLTINGVFGVLCSFATDFTTLLVFRAFQGIGIAGLMPVAMTLINDYYEGGAKVDVMAKLSITTSLGGVLAPLLGGGLAYLNWQYPFYFYGLTIPLAIIILFYLQEPSYEVQKNGMRQYLKDILIGFKNKQLLAVLAAAFLLFFLLYTNVTYLPTKLVNELGFTEMEAGLVLATQAATMSVIALNIREIQKRFTQELCLFLGFFFASLGVFLQGTTDNLLLIVLFLAVFGTGMGLVAPLINDLATELAPKESVGGVTSIYNTMKYVGQTTAPLTLGMVLAMYGRPIAFFASGIIGLIATILSFAIYFSK